MTKLLNARLLVVRTTLSREDKHLLALKQYGNIAIVKASEFLKIAQANLA